MDSLDILKEMSREQAGDFINLIYEYQATGTITTDDFAMKMALAPFINQFKRDEERYESICKRNRENALKGGRPKKPTGNPGIPDEPKKPTGNPGIPDEPKKPAAFAPPPLIEYQEYFLEYAKRKYSDLFPVSKIKCDSFSENDYHYWFDDDCKIMKKKKYSSWKRVAQTSVRSLNTKLKDWEVANSTHPAVTPGVYRNGKEALI